MKKIAGPSTVPTNPEKWSSSSKQSYIYESAPTEYRDRHYKCSRCKVESVYTAEAQQEAYEIRKAYIWQTRKLCIICYRARVDLEKSLVECRQLWQSEKNKIFADSQFLIRWLGYLEAYVQYGGKSDKANIKMLKTLIADLKI